MNIFIYFIIINSNVFVFICSPLFMLLKLYCCYFAKGMMIYPFFSFDVFCIREYIEDTFIQNMYVFHFIFHCCSWSKVKNLIIKKKYH